MPNDWIESMFLGIIWYNLKTLRKNLQKIFDAIHKSVETTMIYTHVVAEMNKGGRVASPLDM